MPGPKAPGLGEFECTRDKAVVASDKETNIGMIDCLAYGTVTSTRSTGPTNVGAGIYEAM